jgi:hypothetical protein
MALVVIGKNNLFKDNVILYTIIASMEINLLMKSKKSNLIEKNDDWL